MKNKIFQASIVALASLAVVSCDDYNDQFGINYKPTDTRSSAFTLADTDYEAIANNEENKKIAARLDQEAGTGTTYADALAALANDKYFTTLASPELYLPAFLTSSTNYLLADEGARYSVTLNFYRDPSGYLKDFEGKKIGSYDMTADDYKSVWGDAANASYLTPATLSQIPGVLNNSVSGAQEGDMMVVNYAYSDLEPSTGGGGSEEPSFTPIADVVANTGGGNYTVKGTVIATYNRGFLLSDETGSILVYLNELNYSVGDVVTVSGTTTAYGGFMQFPNSSEVALLERAETFSYPAPVSVSGAELDAYLTAPEIKYVTYTGTLTIDGKYYNVAVDGASNATASLQYPVVGVVDSSLDGQEVTVTGYLIGTSSSKFVNTMVTSVAPADGSGEEYTPVGLLAYDSEGTQRSVRGVVAATYERGFLLTDGSGNILVYKSDTGAAVGDIMTVSGKLGEHNGFPQFTNDATVTKVGTGEFTLPTPRQLDAESMVAYLSNPYIGLVTYDGVLTIDGNYKNVAIDGTADVEGSLSYITVDEALNGQRVKVVGYAIGTSSNRFFNTMVTSIEPVASTASLRAIGNISTSAANSSALYRFDGNAWSLYETDAASIMPLDPAAYAQYGSSSVAVNAIDDVAAVFLMQRLPFAQNGDLAAVIYDNGSGESLAIKEYMLSKGAWIPTPEYDVKTYLFEYLPEGWTRATTYFNEPLLDGATGGFEIKNVTTGGLSYVWSIDSRYGWKASAYANDENHATESWIVSPQIDLSDAAAPVLQFETALNFWDGYAPTDFCTVLITTDYIGEIEGTTWEELEVTGWPTTSSWDFVTVNPIDLSAYVGKVVNIAFRYKSLAEAAPTWEVKNVKVGEPE